MKSGIYKIENTKTKKIYIGSTINFKIREYNHFKQLKENKHANKNLQNAYNKYGENNFKFEILAKCPKEYLLKLEQWFLNTQKPQYNICPIAGNTLGRRFSEETKKKMSLVSKGRKPTELCIIKSKEKHTGVRV